MHFRQFLRQDGNKKEILKIYGIFSLDGFLQFQVGRRKKKWDEIVVLSNSYDTVINDYDTMRDFLMFLLEAIPTLVNNLSVVFDEESGFELF